MIKLDNVILHTEVQDIMNELRDDLASKGIERFKIMKRTSDDIMTQCPFHSNGQERKPSFGVNVKTGLCHCFSCGWAGTLPMMIGSIYYKDDKYGEKWLLQHFNSAELDVRPSIVHLSSNRQANVKMKRTEGKNEDLNKYRYIHPYMYERGLTDETIEMFDVGFDRDNNCVTFPVYDEYNNLSFVARRSVKTKMYKYPQNVVKPVYALPMVTSKEVFVVESFFNCYTLWQLGLQAVALLGTGTREQYEVLKKSNIRTFILALDPDDAGRKGTVRFRNALSKYKVIKEVQYEEEGKDVNDLQEKFLDLKIIR